MEIYIKRQAFVAEPLYGVARDETSLSPLGSFPGPAHGGGHGISRLHPGRPAQHRILVLSQVGYKYIRSAVTITSIFLKNALQVHREAPFPSSLLPALAFGRGDAGALALTTSVVFQVIPANALCVFVLGLGLSTASQRWKNFQDRYYLCV